MLNSQKTRVETNLTETLDEREVTVGELETVRAEILAMDPKIIELENKIAVEQDAAARTKLETELADLNKQYNALKKKSTERRGIWQRCDKAAGLEERHAPLPIRYCLHLR